MQKRIWLYIFLILCFACAALFREFPLLPYLPFALAAFWGAAGLLLEFAWRARQSLMAIPPLLLAFEVLGDMFYNGQLTLLAHICYVPASLLFTATGLIFVFRAMQEWKKDRRAALSFGIWGLSTLSLNAWKYATAHPETYNSHAIHHRIAFLLNFAILLVIDFGPDLRERGYKREAQVLQTSLYVIAAMFFVRFIFK